MHGRDGPGRDASEGQVSAPRRFGKQRERVGALVLRVALGKVVADVAERGGAEERIGDRVAERVGIGMARKSAIVRNLNAAQHEFSSAAKSMRVKTVPNTDFRCHLR